jgi:polyphosphate kinase
VRRIETMFPVEDPAIRQRLLDEVLGVALRDNVKARRLQVDGTYVPVGREGTAVRSQGVLMELARRNNQPDTKPLQALRHATAPEAPALPRQVPQTGS